MNMGSPLETIKSGLLSGDMNLIAEGYNKMTGESVVVTEHKVTAAYDGLVKALRFYANEENWKRRGPDWQPQPPVVFGDAGHQAREVLGIEKEIVNPFPALLATEAEVKEPPVVVKPAPKTLDIDKFRTQPKGVVVLKPAEKREDGHTTCRRETFVPPPSGQNRFNPDPAEGVEVMAEDREFEKKRAGKTFSRPPGEVPTEIACSKCSHKYMAHPSDLGRVIEGEQMAPVCPRCVRSLIKS